MTPDAPPQKLYRLLMLLAAGTFLALISAGLGVREFWTDEIITAGHVRTLASTADAFHPRGFYVLLYGWKQIFGDSDLALRAFSVPWAMLAFVLAWAISSRLLKPGQTALALWLIALSPFLILYFRMARFYSLVTALVLLVAYCAVLVTQVGKRRHWVALAVVSPSLVYTNYLAALLLGPLFLWLGWINWRRGQVWRLLTAMAPTAVAAVSVGAWVLRVTGNISAIEAGAAHASLSHVLLRLVLPPFILAVGETTDPWRIWVTLPAFAAAAGFFILGLVSSPREAAWAPLRWSWLISVVVAAAVLTTIARGEPLSAAARSTIFAAPLAYMLMAVGATRIGTKSLRAAAIAVLLVANVYGLRNYFAGTQFLNPGYAVPWREIVTTIQQSEQPGDLVLAFFESTPGRYGEFGRFITGRPDYAPHELEPVENWPGGGFRLWLIGRDRGSAEARRLQETTVKHLTPRAARVEITRFMPYSPMDRKFRSFFLRRPVPESHITVYLFIPPDEPRAPEDAPRFLTGGRAPSDRTRPTHPEQDTL
ncbi:MAG: glycosyltransferase family 39 protein [Armatimonadetes bacterium]|nr:glycosyltransferase family 39 protein [Armatimonadota bacterium]